MGVFFEMNVVLYSDVGYSKMNDIVGLFSIYIIDFNNGLFNLGNSWYVLCDLVDFLFI